MDEEKEIIQAFVPKKFADEVRALAEKENRSLSNMIYILLQAALNKDE